MYFYCPEISTIHRPSLTSQTKNVLMNPVFSQCYRWTSVHQFFPQVPHVETTIHTHIYVVQFNKYKSMILVITAVMYLFHNCHITRPTDTELHRGLTLCWRSESHANLLTGESYQSDPLISSINCCLSVKLSVRQVETNKIFPKFTKPFFVGCFFFNSTHSLFSAFLFFCPY